MKLYMSDHYRIQMTYPHDEVSQDILYYLYQPLIGASCLNTYMNLYIEAKRMSRFLQPSLMSRLVSLSGYSLLDLETYIKKLEAIGLLKTFVRNEDGLTYYIFQILSPLSLKQFLNNPILSTLLIDALSLDEYNKTMKYFEVSREDTSKYEEITSSFTDVFDIVDHKQKRLLQYKEVKNKVTKDLSINYDLESLKKYLLELQVPSSLLTNDDYKYVSQIALTYSIEPLTLASFIKDACQSHSFDQDYFKMKIKDYVDIHTLSSFKEIYHKQPLVYKSQSDKKDPLTLHMQYLESITPYDLLKEKQGGSEPVIHDLSVVETLMAQLGLKPAVVNVLIEYSLGKNDHRISKRYLEALGATMARKNILTAMDAYNELMCEVRPPVKEVSKEIVNNDINQDEINQLLRELKNNQ